MNVEQHINSMEYDGWCKGCNRNADDCRKSYANDGEIPLCYKTLLQMQNDLGGTNERHI